MIEERSEKLLVLVVVVVLVRVPFVFKLFDVIDVAYFLAMFSTCLCQKA